MIRNMVKGARVSQQWEVREGGAGGELGFLPLYSQQILEENLPTTPPIDNTAGPPIPQLQSLQTMF